jgi:hypothetical protein
MNRQIKLWLRIVRSLALQLVVTALLLGLPNVFASDDRSNQNVPAEEKDAAALLINAAEFLARQQSFRVTVRSSFDALQDDGRMIEFGEIRKILVKRPDQMRADVTRSDGDQDLLLFNGQTLTAYKATDNVFAQVEFSGTIDSAIVYLVKNLQIRFPLARLWLTVLPEQLKGQIESASYVETNMLYDVPVDQLSARLKEVDVQLWVDQGKTPLLRRVVITYRNDPGQPQFRADFLDWNLSPESSPADFSLTPPAGAEEILFLSPVKPGPSQVDKKGDKS